MTSKNTHRPDYLKREPAHIYHAKASDYLSSHQLAAFRKCPALYQKKKLGEIEDRDTAAYFVGRAAHTLILEGNAAYAAEYAVGGPKNPRTGKSFGPKTKAFAEWAQKVGKPVITEESADLIETMREAVHSHPKATELLAHGIAEGVVRTKYCDVDCQIRIDWLNTDLNAICDLKTTLAIDWAEHDARKLGYIYQLAFYRSVLKQVVGNLQEIPVYMIVVEKQIPFRCGVWKVATDVLDAAERENEAAISRLKVCDKTGHFPTGYEDVRVMEVL